MKVPPDSSCQGDGGRFCSLIRDARVVELVDTQVSEACA